MSTGRIVTIVLCLIVAVALTQIFGDIGPNRSEATDAYETPPVDFYARAACAAVETPVAEALAIDLTETDLWLLDVVDDSLAACRLHGTGSAESASAVTDVIHGFFRYAGWRPYSLFDADGPQGTISAYRRSPITCRYHAEWSDATPEVDYALTIDCFPDVE